MPYVTDRDMLEKLKRFKGNFPDLASHIRLIKKISRENKVRF